jgi:hypothetical protein
LRLSNLCVAISGRRISDTCIVLLCSFFSLFLTFEDVYFRFTYTGTY